MPSEGRLLPPWPMPSGKTIKCSRASSAPPSPKSGPEKLRRAFPFRKAEPEPVVPWSTSTAFAAAPVAGSRRSSPSVL